MGAILADSAAILADTLINLIAVISYPPALLANLLVLVGLRVMSRYTSESKTNKMSTSVMSSNSAGPSSGVQVRPGPAVGAQSSTLRRWVQVVLMGLMIVQVVYLVKHNANDRTSTSTARSTHGAASTTTPATGVPATSPPGGNPSATLPSQPVGGTNGGVVTDESASMSSSNITSVGQTSPPSIRAKSVPRSAAVAVAGLTTQGSLTATLYFGQLRAVMSRLNGAVHFNTDPAYASAHPGQCVSTVVFGSVPGSSASVYAEGLGKGWDGAEGSPSKSLAADNWNAHQQLIVPPGSSDAGTKWTGSAMLVVDGGQEYTSSQYVLALDHVSGSTQIWTVAARTLVQCTL